MALPLPTQYENWEDWASALLLYLSLGDTGVVAGSAASGNLNTPAGYAPVWLGPDTFLYSGNDVGLPPTAPDIVFIDTAKLADAAVTGTKIGIGAVGTTNIADAAIVTALIGDAQIVNAKIADLAVNNAKIANLAVSSAKIQDLAVTNAKIGLLAVANANITDATILSAKIANAQITTALIANAAIINALIANAAIATANIQDGAISTAKIGDAQIVTAKIGDAQITSAKVAELVFDKLTAGTLDAEVDVGTGLLRFAIGGYQMTIGKGFGTLNQFIMWYGPAMAETAMSESDAVFYIKNDGSAYFGGTLLSGVLRTTSTTTDTSTTAEIQIGDFSSNGNDITAILSYSYMHKFEANHGTGAIGAGGAAQVVLEGSVNSGGAWTTLGTLNLSPQKVVIVDSDPLVKDSVEQSYNGSLTVTWNPGAIGTLKLRGRVVSRTEGAMSGTGIVNNSVTQTITVSSTEQP